MNKYNPNIHHRRSIRLKGYDYSQAGLYFITICCYKRKHLFGEVNSEGQMILNEYGIIAHNEWAKTPEIRNNVTLGEFVIMPNHMHGIIQITGSSRGESHSPQFGRGELHSPFDHTGECNSPITNENKGEHEQRKKPLPLLRGPKNNVGAIVRGYKSAVTKQLNFMNIGCNVWHRNYYEHIIRDEKAYQNISNYIINNPMNWNKDKFYK